MNRSVVLFFTILPSVIAGIARAQEKTPVLPPEVAIAKSVPAFDVRVDKGHKETRQLIQREAERLWSEHHLIPSGSDASKSGSIPSRVQIKVEIGDQDAKGSSRYSLDDDGRLRDVKIELEGSIDEIVRDELPRQISHILLTNAMKEYPLRWLEMGTGLLAESEMRQSESWRQFREVRDAGNLISAGEILSYREYPEDTEKLSVLYVQSMALTEFVTTAWNQETLLAFAKDASLNGAPIAVRNHLGFETVGAFDLAFRQWAEQR